jgi:uncharacterized protein
VTRVLAALALALLVPHAGAQWEATSEGLAPIPALTGRVVDLTSTLSAPDAQALTAKLAAWEQKTGNQLAVLIVPSTQPEPIETYSIRVAEAWKIGRKGQDNGALLVVAKDDRKLRIEVGYGLEGSLTDATSKRIIAETIAPLFREGKFAQGIDAGADQIMAVVDKGEPLPAKPQAKPPPGGGFSFEMLLVVVFLVIPIMGGILRRIFGRFLGSTVGAGIIGAGAWVVMGSLLVAGIAAAVAFFILLVTSAGSMLARRGGGVWIPSGGGWGGGGWGGGSGGGGFSGGGGGFGGGGASGNW